MNRSRKTKIALLTFGLAAGTLGGLHYLETLPKVAGLGPHVSIQVLEQVDGVAWRLSRNGKYYSVARDGAPISALGADGKLIELEAPKDTSMLSIAFIANSGIARGYLFVSESFRMFEADQDGKIRYLEGQPYAVRDASADGHLLIGEEVRPPEEPIIVRDGVASRFVSLPNRAGRLTLQKVSADGKTILAQAGPDTMPYGLLIAGDIVRELRIPFKGVRPNTISSNGRFALLESGRELFLAGPKGIQSISKFASQKGDWWTDAVDWVRKNLYGRRGPLTLVPGVPEGIFVSSDGSWAIASPWQMGSRPLELPTLAWSKRNGWVTLDDEIQKRRGRFPPGWKLGGINAVSDDGQTMVGYAVRGKRQAPLILRFSQERRDNPA